MLDSIPCDFWHMGGSPCLISNRTGRQLITFLIFYGIKWQAYNAEVTMDGIASLDISMFTFQSAVHYHCLLSLPYMTEVNFKAEIPLFYQSILKWVLCINIVLWYSKHIACTEMLETKQQESTVYSISRKTCSPHHVPDNILFHIEIKYPLIKKMTRLN